MTVPRGKLLTGSILLALSIGTGARAAEMPDPVSERLSAIVAELSQDQSSTRAFVSLVEIESLEDELPDLTRAAAVYRALVDRRRLHPEVRAYARYRLAALERSRGNLRRSEAELARLAFLDEWQISGPFDNEWKRGFDRVFPPEKRLDLADRYPGKGREVGWRALPPEAVSMGFVNLGAVIRPPRDMVVYALALVESPRSQKVQLHVGASGAVKVFVNGSLVLADPTYHPVRLDQSAATFTLPKGASRVLVKLCHVDGRAGFFARLSTAAGEPLRLPSPGAPPPPSRLMVTQRGEPVPGVMALLARRARSARGSEEARARQDLAIGMTARRPGEERERRAVAEASRAVEISPRSVEARLLAARIEPDPDRRREHLEAALRTAPGDARVLAALAASEMQSGRLPRARALLGRALAASPRYVAAGLLLADLDEQVGFVAQARARREALAREHPFHPGAVRAAARAARALDRLDVATQLLRKTLALRYDDEPARSALVQALLDRGDADGAARLLEEAIQLAPGDMESRLRLAELFASNGRAEESEAAFAAAIRIAPDDPDIRERRGQVRLRDGRPSNALQDFHVALKLRPQNPRLKELVRAIEPTRERFEKPYEHDVRQLAQTAPAPEKDEDAIVLAELKVTKVFPSGLSSSFTQLIVKVLTQRGANAWRSWSTSYVHGRQEVRVERARVVKPDGAMVQTSQESEQSASEPWYRLYYDTRARVLSFPSLAPGDVLEISVRTDDVAAENLLSDYFGEVVPLADRVRKLRVDYVLLLPEGRRIHTNEPAFSRVEHAERVLADGVVERRWTARDVPRLRAEPGMPGWSEVIPYVHVSTYGDWDEVARFYWNLVKEQLTVTPEIRRVASRLAAETRAQRRARGAPEAGDERALVEAVHRFVVTNTRYVGLEIGIHGYKPYRVEQVLERRFGDCKDKASLTHALLAALGIDSRLVLLRMKRLGTLPERPASLAVFNHAILFVPGHDLWLDGTASYSGSRDLPDEDRGAAVLIVNPGQPARFTRVPEGRPEDNSSSSRYHVRIGADGSAAVSAEARIVGIQAPRYRMAYSTEHDRIARLEQALGRSFPGLAIEEVSVSDLSRLEDEVVMRFTMAVPKLAEPDGPGLRFAPFGAGQRYVESMAPLSGRQYDLVLGEPWQLRFTYRYTLPRGFSPLDVPPPTRVDTPFGAFEVGSRFEADSIVAEALVTMKVSRVAARDYAAFREFLSRLDRALSRPVRIAPEAAVQTFRRQEW